MRFLTIFIPFIVPIGIFGLLLASLRTGIRIIKLGNEADPLRKEIEEENREERISKAA